MVFFGRINFHLIQTKKNWLFGILTTEYHNISTCSCNYGNYGVFNQSVMIWFTVCDRFSFLTLVAKIKIMPKWKGHYNRGRNDREEWEKEFPWVKNPLKDKIWRLASCV